MAEQPRKIAVFRGFLWRAPYEQATIFAGRFLLGTRQGMTPGLHAVGDVCTGG